ncbi:hypothetical protein ZOSMA_96G00640 [Zostera marina]|uniref:Uncharacterized protein n=1 Tax=Zostera marina TaxID=29655 RepID=A0A0K9NID7_ZOSMR|nr:hypothetical protein ZOSMA_96G00640 [Zostera marina]
MSVENLFNSPDRSPIQSPIAKRHVLRSRNVSAPSSPLHQMIFPESSSGKYDNNVNVHPLPLPPISSNNYPASFSRQSVTKGDMSAMRHQW